MLSSEQISMIMPLACMRGTVVVTILLTDGLLIQRLLVWVVDIALEGQGDAAAAWLRWRNRHLEGHLEFARFAKGSIYGAFVAFLRDHLQGCVQQIKPHHCLQIHDW